MDFKLFRGNKTSGAVLLLFVILIISQSRVFDMLIENALGRTLLVALIIASSYMNKMLGVVSVLLFIIAFSTSRVMEGMEKMTTTDTTIDTTTDTITDTTDLKDKETDKLLKDKIMIDKLTDKLLTDKIAADNSTTKDEKEDVINAKEGFDLLGKEDMMRRSKDSKKIPVQKTTNSVEGFEPFDDEFTSYSMF